MALRFIDSFDHYITADIVEKWTIHLNGTPGALSQIIQPGVGRRSTGAMRINISSWNDNANGVGKTLGTVSGSTAIMGVAVNLIGGTPGTQFPLFQIYDGGTPQISVYLLPSLQLQVRRGNGGGAILGTVTAPVTSVGSYTYYELKTVIHPSTGMIQLRVNNVIILEVLNINTSNNGSSTWNGISLCHYTGDAYTGAGNPAQYFDYDDLYVCDGSGAGPWNDYLGDCRVDALFPTAPGATSNWAPSAGANWECVDDAAPDDDLSYVSATAPGQIDTYTFADLPIPSAVVHGVQHVIAARKTDAGTGLLAPVTRQAGVDYVGSDVAPGVNYGYFLQMAATNPASGTAWTVAQVNAAEFGLKRTG